LDFINKRRKFLAVHLFIYTEAIKKMNRGITNDEKADFIHVM